MSDFLDTAQAHPDISSVFAQDDGASMIQMLLLYAPDAFIDYDAAQASFDSPEFLCLLELAKRQTQPEAESPREALLTGQTLLEQLMFGRAQEFEAEYADGLNELSFPGFPGAGSASFYLTLPMAIPVNAQEKEGAWAFLKLLITEPLYAARSRGGWLPVQSDFEKKTAAMTDTDAQQLLRELQAEAVSVFGTMPPFPASLPTSCRIISRRSGPPDRSQTASSAAFSCTLKKPVAESRGFRCCAETRRMI